MGGAFGTSALAAQEQLDPRKDWVDQLYPFFYYSSTDGFWFSGHYDVSSPISFVERPEPSFGRVALDAGGSTQGSYAFILDGQLPAYWDGWRLGLTLSLIRGNRLGYYGQGNDAPFDSDSLNGRSHFYQVARTTGGARATVQRRLVGRLRALVGGTLDHTDFRELPGGSVFQRDRASGTITDEEDPFNDAVGRVGLVFDSRDLEADPHGGLLPRPWSAGGAATRARRRECARTFAHSGA